MPRAALPGDFPDAHRRTRVRPGALAVSLRTADGSYKGETYARFCDIETMERLAGIVSGRSSPRSCPTSRRSRTRRRRRSARPPRRRRPPPRRPRARRRRGTLRAGGRSIASGSRGPVGRLAPSPTGLLHLGNARTFRGPGSPRERRADASCSASRTWTLSARSRGRPSARSRTHPLGLDWDGPALSSGGPPRPLSPGVRAPEVAPLPVPLHALRGGGGAGALGPH